MSESESDAEKCLEHFEDCEQRQVGDVSNRIVKFITERRTFKNIGREIPFPRFPCACCNGDFGTFQVDPNDYYFSQSLIVCPQCQAPICPCCIDFISRNSWAEQIKRCRWCSSRVHPLCEHDLHSPPNVDILKLLLDILKAQENFQAFINWKSRLFQHDLYFDFSKIIWAPYFDRIGWQFFVNAKNFFEQKLRLECELVFARISCFNTESSRKKFAGPYYSFHANTMNLLFPQSRNAMLIKTFAFRALRRMNYYHYHHFQHFVLRRLGAIWGKRLSDGLGICGILHHPNHFED
jgi:hypothetical protein